MARTTLADRQARLEQQRARLQVEENRLREAERKDRTRRLIEAGGLVHDAGLLHLDAPALLGALLTVAADVGQQDRVARWREAGQHAIDRATQDRADGQEPLVITLPAAATAPIQAQLRRAGFRWSKILHHWEGLAVYETAAAMASEHGGSIERVRLPLDPRSDEPVESASGAL